MNENRSVLNCLNSSPVVTWISSSSDFADRYDNKYQKCLNRQRYVKLAKNCALLIEEFILLGIPDEGWITVGHSYWKVYEEVTDKGVRVEAFIQNSPIHEPNTSVYWIDAISVDDAIDELLADIVKREISPMFLKIDYCLVNLIDKGSD